MLPVATIVSLIIPIMIAVLILNFMTPAGPVLEALMSSIGLLRHENTATMELMSLAKGRFSEASACCSSFSTSPLFGF